MVFDISAFKGKFNPAIGTIIQFSDNNPNNIDPTGSSIEQWKLCNGQSLSKSTYSELFSIIGDKYGSGSSTFNLPDYRGRLIVGNGPVDGETSPFIGNFGPIDIGSTGGFWEVNASQLSPNDYISIGDYEVSGWENLITTAYTQVTGTWEMQFGPLEDSGIRGVPEHSHPILACEVNDQIPVYPQSNAIDPYGVCYISSRGFMESFEPVGGIPLSHSHAIIKGISSNVNLATVGNTDGIGETDSDGEFRISVPTSFSISSASNTPTGSSYVVITTSGNHGFSIGDFVNIRGLEPSILNGNFQIVSGRIFSENRFTYKPISYSGGSVRVRSDATVTLGRSTRRVVTNTVDIEDLIAFHRGKVVAKRIDTPIAEFSALEFGLDSFVDVGSIIPRFSWNFYTNPSFGSLPGGCLQPGVNSLVGSGLLDYNFQQGSSGVDIELGDHYIFAGFAPRRLTMGPFVGAVEFQIIYAPAEVKFRSTTGGEVYVQREVPGGRGIDDDENLYFNLYSRPANSTVNFTEIVNEDVIFDANQFGGDDGIALRVQDKNLSYVYSGLPRSADNEYRIVIEQKGAAACSDHYGIFLIRVKYYRQTTDVVGDINEGTVGAEVGSVGYNFSPKDLSFISTPAQVQMSRFNNINVRHSLSSDFRTFSLQNKYKRVYYWIKVI